MADYTTLEFADASVIVRSTGRELARLEKLKGGVANSSTLAECTDGTRVVITVLDNHSWDSATSLCELTDFLIGAGIVTPPFLKFADSRELWDLHGRPVVVRPFLSGDQPMHLSAAQATRVGAALAGLHRVSPSPSMGLPSRRLPDDWRERLGVHAPHTLVSLLASASEELASLGGLPVQLIHGDLFPDNMIWTSDGVLHLLDWETASSDWGVLDLGFTIVGLSGDAPIDRTLTDAIVAGYEAAGGARPSARELAVACQYACMVLMYHRYIRHVIRYPDPSRTEHWKRLIPFVESVVH